MTHNKSGVSGFGSTPVGAADQRDLLFGNSVLPTMDKAVLVLLVTIDLTLILIHIGTGASFEKIPALLNISLDYSIGEFFNYAKWVTIIGILWVVSRRVGNPALLACASLFAVMLADDSLQIHERFGELAVSAGQIGDASWATGQTLAEIAVWGALAGLLLPVILFGLWKSTREQWLPAFRFLGLIALFAVFGGLVDALHQPVEQLPFGVQLVDLIEDGGEMIVASIIVAHAVTLWNETAALARFRNRAERSP